MRWIVERAHILPALGARGIRPWPGSPLFEDVPRLAAETPNLADDALEALSAIAQPRLHVRLALGPPHGSMPLDLFRGRNAERRDFVAWYDDPETAKVMVVTLAESNLVPQIEACMGPGRAAASPSRDLSPGGLRALVGVSDAVREAELRAQLERLPFPEGQLTLDEVEGALERSIRGDDAGWVGCVVGNLMQSALTGDTEAGLYELAAAGLLERRGPSWRLLPDGLGLAQRLQHPLTWCGLSGRPLGVAHPPPAEHLVALLYETTAVLLRVDGSGRVRMSDTPRGGGSADFVDLLDEWALRPPLTSAPMQTCRSCGATDADLRARFCQECGAPLRGNE